MGAPRVALCSPAYDGRAHVTYFRGLNDIRRVFGEEGIETAFIDAGSSANLPRLRNALCAFAFDWGADAILWIDTDIAGTGADALRLWKSGKDIIGAAPQKRPSSLDQIPSVAFQPLPGDTVGIEDGLIEVGAVPTAFCITRKAVFERMRDENIAKRMVNSDCPQSDWFRNFFWYELVPHGDGWLDEGEDYYFCRKARSLGFRCFIEPEVRPIHHEGQLKLSKNFMDIHGRSLNGDDR